MDNVFLQRRVFLAILLLLVTGSVKAQQGNETNIIKETIIHLFDGIAELNLAKVEENTAPGFLLLENGAVWNLDSLAVRLETLKKMAFKRVNEFTFTRTEITGNTAWVVYNNTARMTINGKQRNVKWLESAFLLKEGKKWKVRVLHSTTLPPGR